MNFSDVLRLIRNHLHKQSFTLKVTPQQEALWASRLNVLVNQILPGVRSEGNLLLPVSYQADKGDLSVHTMRYPKEQVDLDASSADELLMILRSVCAQIVRLHEADYLLGADLKDAILCYLRKGMTTSALCLISVPEGGKPARLLGFSGAAGRMRLRLVMLWPPFLTCIVLFQMQHFKRNGGICPNWGA